VVEWTPLFTRKAYFDLLLDALQFCRRHKGLKPHAYVILDNHMHLVVAGPQLADTIRDFKSFTAKRLLARLEQDDKTWVLNQLQYWKRPDKTRSDYQVWQEGFHPQWWQTGGLPENTRSQAGAWERGGEAPAPSGKHKRVPTELAARLDGKFVLTTNTALTPAEVARTYKSLWRVERTFREQKSALEVRPLYHHRDDTSMGRIVASFPALRLEVDLQQRLGEREVKVSWPDLMRGLGQVQSVRLELDGQRYQLGTDLRGAAHQGFAAAGVRPPPLITPPGSAAGT